MSDPSWNPLPPPARWVYALSGAVGSAMSMGLLLAVVIGFSLALEWRLYIPWYVAAFVVWSALGLYRGHVRWRYTRWLLDDTGFRIRRGWLWRSEVLVPRARVQHLDIDRGPIERRFNLATLTVYTAGTSNSAVTLSSLGDGDAVALRDALLPERGRDDDAI